MHPHLAVMRIHKGTTDEEWFNQPDQASIQEESERFRSGCFRLLRVRGCDLGVDGEEEIISKATCSRC